MDGSTNKTLTWNDIPIWLQKVILRWAQTTEDMYLMAEDILKRMQEEKELTELKAEGQIKRYGFESPKQDKFILDMTHEERVDAWNKYVASLSKPDSFFNKISW